MPVMPVSEDQVYDLIGEDGFNRLVGAFYRRIPADDLLGPMYRKGDFASAEQRLRDFLIGRFGGPQRYIEQRGHPRLRMRHHPFKIDQAARDRWVQLMEAAIGEVNLEASAADVLRNFFKESATFLINHG